jgi:hypothetical protein
VPVPVPLPEPATIDSRARVSTFGRKLARTQRLATTLESASALDAACLSPYDADDPLAGYGSPADDTYRASFGRPPRPGTGTGTTDHHLRARSGFKDQRHGTIQVTLKIQPMYTAMAR